MHCNCENLKCPHGKRPCRNEAGEKKVMYVGAVCDACYERMPAEFRLPRKKLFEVIVGGIEAVYRGTSSAEAADAFEDYMQRSKTGHGRARGESVVLLEDGEITVEYDP